MIRIALIILTVVITSAARAHEMVPTYPVMKPAYVDGLQKVTMTMFNKRAEVEYYEIGVFTKDWKTIPFVSDYKVFKIPYLTSVSFDVYIRDQDRNIVTYICSKSKLRKEELSRTAVSSRICSKVKRNGTK
jgi:hypothetical protein|tara:strand:- start:2224 stop:2616 length:393 start_codon:yes stop_codon:yes gene_type:complete